MTGTLEAWKRRVTLAKCPVGLFLYADDTLCLKTEYGNNEGRIDAYIVDSGEFFWGDNPQTIAHQREQMVRPVRYALAPAPKGKSWIADLLAAHPAPEPGAEE
jgi:hypothetical protein